LSIHNEDTQYDPQLEILDLKNKNEQLLRDIKHLENGIMERDERLANVEKENRDLTAQLKTVKGNRDIFRNERDSKNDIINELEAENCSLKNKLAITQQVIKPTHYNAGNYEVIDIIKDQLTPVEFLGFCKGTSLRYICREGNKGGVIDLDKCNYYIKQAIDNYPEFSDIENQVEKFNLNAFHAYIDKLISFFRNKASSMNCKTEHHREMYSQLFRFFQQLSSDIDAGKFETMDQLDRIEFIGTKFGIKKLHPVAKQEDENNE
jgi:hypothetical protein